MSLCCVLEQDIFILAYILVQPRKTYPDITEKLLTGTKAHTEYSMSCLY